MSHSHFNTGQYAAENGRKNQSANELSGMEKGDPKGENSSESRRNSLNRVLEAIISESNSYSNPGVVVTGADFHIIVLSAQISLSLRARAEDLGDLGQKIFKKSFQLQLLPFPSRREAAG